MNEMEKRKKAIAGLESIHAVAVGDGAFYVTECGMGDFNRLLADAIALLKAQEPRVMTLDEACTADCVWYDWRTQGIRPAKVNRVQHKNRTYRVLVFGDIDQWVHADEYGEYWRCWSSRPTDEQREATPWRKDSKREAQTHAETPEAAE